MKQIFFYLIRTIVVFESCLILVHMVVYMGDANDFHPHHHHHGHGHGHEHHHDHGHNDQPHGNDDTNLSRFCPCCQEALDNLTMNKTEGFDTFPWVSIEEGRLDEGLAAIRNGHTAVDFDDAQVNEEQMELILAELSKPSCQLEALSLYESELNESAANRLAEILLYDSKLKFLNLSGYPIPVMALRGEQQRIGDEGTSTENQAVVSEDQPEVIDYTGIDLSEEKFNLYDTIVIGKLFANSKHILVLDLSSSEINDEAIGPIADALSINTSLLELNLSSNQIASTGAMLISEALTKNQTLTELYLDNNVITVEGANSIAAMLAVNETLLRLHVRKNSFGSEGADVLMAALESNTIIESFSCDNVNETELPNLGFEATDGENVLEPSLKT
uniref:Uncharacterized protein n=1 Tax=Aplanochytrium stocchinoi TaxID=215587 RepID=A0A6S8DV42_9STRA|mmetsp:Transcript_21524/g.27491  ORF Transcript_21524/g.27491 Transcript_21524/m.27491 type:complete len:389 (-) Transcript_21524:1237-2403(-)